MVLPFRLESDGAIYLVNVHIPILSSSVSRPRDHQYV